MYQHTKCYSRKLDTRLDPFLEAAVPLQAGAGVTAAVSVCGHSFPSDWRLDDCVSRERPFGSALFKAWLRQIGCEWDQLCGNGRARCIIICHVDVSGIQR